MQTDSNRAVCGLTHSLRALRILLLSSYEGASPYALARAYCLRYDQVPVR